MIESIVFNVTGMKCGGCEANVIKALTAIEGVSAVSASSQTKQVQVNFTAEKVTADALAEAITAAGYSVEPR